jgi:hypothetical protein
MVRSVLVRSDRQRGVQNLQQEFQTRRAGKQRDQVGQCVVVAREGEGVYLRLLRFPVALEKLLPVSRVRYFHDTCLSHISLLLTR